MDSDRWERIGDLFDAAQALPPADRGAWLGEACGADAQLRTEVVRLLEHDSLADADGWLSDPRRLVLEGPGGGDFSGGPSEAGQARDPDGFSPRPALRLGHPPRSNEETRSAVQARLRELPIIHILVFGIMLILRPLVLGSLSPSIVPPFALLAASFLVLALVLTTRAFSLESLRRIDFGMSLALAAILVAYESQAIIGSSFFQERIKAEKIMKNVILLASFLMLIDAIYVPKGWRQAAALSLLLAFLPLGTLIGVSLVDPELVEWVPQLRADGNKPLVVFAIDTAFLLTLAGISTFAAHMISRLRSDVIEARRFGQYRLGARIGVGGMGEVYLAEHEMLKRPCAVKLIRPEVVLKAGTLDRFEREVRITATLSHPNTVEIFDYGRTEDGTYYYVMEYLPGMSLARLVDLHGPLPPGRAVYLLRQVALALQEAHEADLIHRDVKPSNIFAAHRGGMFDVAKILDFGLVRPSGQPLDASGPPAEEGQIVGTPHYMSPEQVTRSVSLDARSDIYSLGAVAYFLITGRPPFDVPSPLEAIIAHVRESVVPPSDHLPELPADLEAIILRCLAKDRADRYPDARSLELALGRCSCVPDWDKEKARDWWQS